MPEIEALENRRLLAATVVDFEDLSGPQAGAAGVYDAPGGYRFENQRSTGELDAAGPKLYGPSRGFSSNLIQPANWGERVVITRPDGQPFTLNSFDYGSSVYGNAGDFAVTTVSTGGSSAPQVVSFSGQRKPLQTLTLNRQNLTRVVIEFDGYVNPVGGTLDNFRLETGGGTGAGGGAATGFGEGGRTTLDFVGDNFAEVRQSVPTPDGGFYAVGLRGDINVPRIPAGIYASAYEPTNLQPFVAKFRADGRLDPAFSGDGLASPAELGLPANGVYSGLTPAPGGGFLAVGAADDAGFRSPLRVLKLTSGFRLDPAFGGGDGAVDLPDYGFFEPRGDGTILFVGRPADAGKNYLEIYNADGSLRAGSRRELTPILGDRLPVKSADLAPDGSLYLTAGDTYSFGPGGAAPFVPPGANYELRYAAVVKTTPSLSLDTAWADGGRLLTYFGTTDFFGGNSQVFAGPDGRMFARFSEDDNEGTYVATSQSGEVLVFQYQNTLFPNVYQTRQSEFIYDVHFAPDGSFAVAGSYNTFQGQVFATDGVTEVLGVRKFKADGTADASFGNDGLRSFFNTDNPITINDADFAADGKLLAVGSDGAATVGPDLDPFDGRPLVTAVNVAASVRRLDVFASMSTRTSVTVDFQAAPLGPTPAAGYADPSGFTFTSVDGGRSLTSTSTTPLRVYGPERGYPSKVLHPDNWGRAIVVKRPDGKAFDLAGLKYAASVFGDAGDLTLVGRFADGSTRTLTQAFGRSKTPQRLAVNWTGLEQVAVNFADGVNPAYGAVDDFELSFGGSGTGGGGTGPTARGLVVEAEEQAFSSSGDSLGRWAQVAGGVGTSVQATPDTGRNLRSFDQYAADGPTQAYRMRLPAAGRYYIWARGRGVAGDAGNSDSVHFGRFNIDTRTASRVATAEAVSFGSDQFTWSNTRFGDGGRAYIDVGESEAASLVLGLFMREDGTILDRFLLTSDPDYVPTGDGPAAGLLA